MLEIKQKIEKALKNCDTGNLFENSIVLFNSLGYNTNRQSRLDNPTYIEFEKNFLEQNGNIPNIAKFKEKAQTDKGQKIELLYSR